MKNLMEDNLLTRKFLKNLKVVLQNNLVVISLVFIENVNDEMINVDETLKTGNIDRKLVNREPVLFVCLLVNSKLSLGKCLAKAESLAL